jgi:magnesium chelatase family protein
MRRRRRFDRPTHTIFDTGLISVGCERMPVEISIEYNGVLFINELTEFKYNTIKVLRQNDEKG